MRPRWLLDKDDIEQEIYLENSVNNKIILINILRKDTNVF